MLVIELARATPVAVAGRAWFLPAGRYAYCGSARGPGGIRARVARHLRRNKRPHWHVDRLTERGRIVAVASVPGGAECALVAAIAAEPGVTAPLPGFGASDCRRRCPAHLLRVPGGWLPPAGGILLLRASYYFWA